MGPYLIGALAGKDTKDSLKKGFEIERAFLQDAKLDLSGISQGDAAAAIGLIFFLGIHVPLSRLLDIVPTTMFFFAATDSWQDGTLAKIQRQIPARDTSSQKLALFRLRRRLNGKMMLNGKGLAVTSSRIGPHWRLRRT